MRPPSAMRNPGRAATVSPIVQRWPPASATNEISSAGAIASSPDVAAAAAQRLDDRPRVFGRRAPDSGRSSSTWFRATRNVDAYDGRGSEKRLPCADPLVRVGADDRRRVADGRAGGPIAPACPRDRSSCPPARRARSRGMPPPRAAARGHPPARHWLSPFRISIPHVPGRSQPVHRKSGRGLIGCAANEWPPRSRTSSSPSAASPEKRKTGSGMPRASRCPAVVESSEPTITSTPSR